MRNNMTNDINTRLITLTPVELEHIYDYTFNEYLDDISKFPINLQDTVDPYIHVRTFPYVLGVVGKITHKNLNMSLAELHARATQLGASKIQHYDWVQDLIESSYNTLNSGDLYGSYGILAGAGYPYATEELKSSFGIRVKEWVNHFICDSHNLLGIPKSQLVCICFMEGIKDYEGLHPTHKKKIESELNAFHAYVDYKKKVLG